MLLNEKCMDANKMCRMFTNKGPYSAVHHRMVCRSDQIYRMKSLSTLSMSDERT